WTRSTVSFGLFGIKESCESRRSCPRNTKARPPCSDRASNPRKCGSACRNRLRNGLRGIDAHAPLLLGPFEFHDPVDQRKQRMISAQAHITARLERGAALPDEDRARAYGFAGKLLYTQHLRLAVSPVPRTAD